MAMFSKWLFFEGASDDSSTSILLLTVILRPCFFAPFFPVFEEGSFVTGPSTQFLQQLCYYHGTVEK